MVFLKRSFTVLNLVLFFATAACGQNNSDQIAEIEKKCQEIKDNLNNYRKVEKFRDSSGHRSAFLNGTELKLVQAQAMEHVVKKTVDWYFSEGHMIYCEQKWVVTTSGEIFNHEKLYLHNDQLIRWTRTDGSETDPSTPDFKETSFYLVEYGKTLLKEAAE